MTTEGWIGVVVSVVSGLIFSLFGQDLRRLGLGAYRLVRQRVPAWRLRTRSTEPAERRYGAVLDLPAPAKVRRRRRTAPSGQRDIVRWLEAYSGRLQPLAEMDVLRQRLLDAGLQPAAEMDVLRQRLLDEKLQSYHPARGIDPALIEATTPDPTRKLQESLAGLWSWAW